MTSVRAFFRAALCAAVISAVLFPAGGVSAESTQNRLRKEKSRLTEMRKKAERAAAELDAALRKEKAARNKVTDLQKRIAHQRRIIDRIDRRLSALSREMEKAESEVRAAEEERARTLQGLERAAMLAFVAEKEPGARVPVDPPGERMRYFTARVLASGAARYGRLETDKEEKESALSGIERQVQLSEKRISREKKVGRSLATQREREADRLQEVRSQKERKAKELKALRARVAKMEALVSRIERRMREAESRLSPKQRGAGPWRFSSIPGGVVAPVRGTVVGPYGKFRDPVFDVEVENRGVEIEAASGAPIRSIGKGAVVFSGTVSGFGKVLIIQHGSGLFSVYGKADSFSVSQDEIVAPGQNIGRLPESPDGKSVLYLELRAGGTAIDPMTVISLTR